MLQLREKQAKERAERIKMLKKGVDMLDENQEVTLTKRNEISSIFARLKKLAFDFTEFITPLGERTQQIKLQEDKSVASVFITYRFLIALSMINLVGFLYMLTEHLFDAYVDHSAICLNNLPCFFFYSSFEQSHGPLFGIHFFCFILLGLSTCLYKWIMYDRESKRIEIFND